MTKIGFIGSGNMASAIIAGVIKSGNSTVSLSVYDINRNNYETLAEQGVAICETAGELISTCDMIVLSVKPQNMADVLTEIRGSVKPDVVFISIAAGISDSYISEQLGFQAKVVLVMPNTPLLLGVGATAMAKGDLVSQEEFEIAESLFSSGGKVDVIQKDQMKEIIAVNSSSPAFIYLFSKGFLEYAEKSGLDKDVCLDLFAATLKGAAAMMTESGYSIDELIKMVSSPGGTTLAGLDVLYKNKLIDIVVESCEACTKRAYELAK